MIKRWVVIASCTFLILIAGIAALLWFESRQQNALRNNQLNIKNTLRSIEIKRPGKTDLKIRAENDNWFIHEPCNIAVNQKRFQPLLSIAPPANFSYAASEVDLEAAGLTHARRGNRVEFIPEWILPLLNGGLSALATLEVFNEVITSVTVKERDSVESTLSQDLETWQQLAAQQIVPWPLAESKDANVKASSQAQYSVIVKSEANEKHLTVFTTPTYSAIVFQDALCAYLVPNDALHTAL